MRNIRKILTNNTVLAPMAGYADSAYRSICKQYGAGLTVTEMVSAKALMMGNVNTDSLLVCQPNDSNCCVQIFGHEVEAMSSCINLPQMQCFDIIDINMGCPVRKIVGNGDGSALMSNMALASNIISAVKLNAKDRFVTVKFRLGVDTSANVIDFARMCQDSGADMITVHFRTAKQLYAGQADYSLLPNIASSVDIPVIANGDISTADQYLYLTRQCGAYGVAVGRGALGRPYVFQQLLGQQYQYSIMDTLTMQTQLMSEYKPCNVVVSEIKKHIPYYLKYFRHNKSTIMQINQCQTVQQMLEIVGKFIKEYNNDTYSVGQSRDTK